MKTLLAGLQPSQFSPIRRTFFGVFLTSWLFFGVLPEAARATDVTIPATAEAMDNPPRVVLSWTRLASPPNSSNVFHSIAIYRREYGAAEPLLIGTITDAQARSFTDNTITPGVLYEYVVAQNLQNITNGSIYPFSPNTWVSSGLEVGLQDSPGRVLLLVDQTMAAPLAPRIDQFQRNLIGAGWKTLRQNVARDKNAPGNTGVSDSRPTKQVITDALAAHPDLNAVILIGRVTIPFSGSIDPDGHGRRAHSTDAYYADTNEVWGDTINHSTQLTPVNVPGDLRWDKSVLDDGRELMVGRIDMAGLPTVFAPSELQLLDRYFHKNHAFRTGVLQAVRRGFWTTNLPYLDQTVANMYSYFGGNATENRGGSTSWNTITATQTYLWGAAGASGSSSSTTGISTTAMAASEYKVVFATFGASYMMQTWTNANALRAFIAMPTWGLGSMVSHSFYGEVVFPGFSMGRPLGEINLGPTTRFPRYLGSIAYGRFWHYAQQGIFANLQGDPTLRMYVTLPPARLEVEQNGDSAQLTWQPSSAPNLMGYHVYRSDGWESPFNRLTSQPVAATNFTDATPRTGDVIYMVRAVALETRGTGTYHAASQGIFAPLSLTGQSNLPPTATLTTFTVPEDGSVVVTLAGEDPEGDVLTTVIIRPPQHGSLVLEDGSNFRYTPRPGFARTDSFAYVVNDGYQDSPAVEVQIPVTPDARPPRAAFWTLEERPVGQSASTAANAILDLHPDGQNIHLTASQAFPVAAGAPEFGGGRALDFQNNGNLTLSDAASGNAFDYGATQSFTIEAVFRVAEGYTATAGLVAKDNGTALSSWYVRLDSRRIRFQVGDHATSSNALSTALITNSNWRHVAAIRDATNPANKRLKIYLDGQLITDAADTTQHSLTNGNALTVGTLFNNSSRLTGFIDMVRITPRVLDPAEFLRPFTQFDADGDGISDTYERTAFGNLAMVGSGDRDGDGSNDLLEFALGTDPTSAGSAPALLLDPRSTELEITHRQRELPSWLSLELQSSTDLVRWEPLASTRSQSTLGAGLMETTHIALFPQGVPDRIFLRLVLHRQ